jgi:hypothetical protein
MAYKITSTFNFPTDTEYWQTSFTLDLNRPGAWILSARDLLDHIQSTTDILQIAWIKSNIANESRQHAPPPRGLHRVFLLLSALVVENLLKAIVVNQANWPDSQIAEKIPTELKSHKLLTLASHGHVSLTNEEADLLERLTEFGIWLGRYPAPTELKQLKPQKLRNGTVNIAGFMYGSDIREVESLINKLIDCLKGVQGIEHLSPFQPRPHEDFEGVSISPSVRAW